MSYRTIRFLVWVFLAALAVFAVAPCVWGDGWRPFLNAIRHEESRGDDRAVGDQGRSRGPVQCGRAAWQDGCEYLGVAWDYDKCVWLRFESEAVLIAYTQRWGARTWEERARCWNSGPDWRKKYHLTNGYWEKVKRELRRKP